MLTKSQKRVVLGAAALVGVVLFVVPAINIGRYRLSVAESLSQALGREVSVQGISIQTFPQPGLLLSGVVVADDPSISAEPILRADEVLATLRFSSLWRGRLEIAALKLKYPSLNLVRSNEGRWNLESLLERARETPTAPTAQSRPETRSRFPYIESDGGRINLKLGNEKTVYALTDADFAVWLAAEDEWRMRLEARPIRTDANLSDTGTVKMQATWRRAPNLHQTPISLRLWWDYGQLGQISHLFYGRDRGWRGGVHVSAAITGKPEELAIHFDTKVEDFRRYDILSGESVSLEAHCSTSYDFSTKQVRNLACQMPAGGGVVLARGSYDFLPNRKVDVSVTAENVPLQFLALLARHAKRDLPSDMKLTGMMSAAFAVRGDYGHRTWAGSGEMSDVEIRSTVLTHPLVLKPSRWSLYVPGSEPHAKSRLRKKTIGTDIPEPSSVAWRLQPVPLKLGDGDSGTLVGWFSRTGYYTELSGNADLDRLFEFAKLAGLPKPASDVTGSAKGAVQISGEWAGFVPPTITGDAQLKNVTVKFNGVAAPLHVSSGHFTATKTDFKLTKATAAFTGMHSTLQMTASSPQHCTPARTEEQLACGIQFNVSADQLNVDEINSLLNPKAQKRPWYAAIANTVMGSTRAQFPDIYAQGQISSKKVEIKSVFATQLNSTLTITPTGFSLDDISAGLLGGKFAGELHSDFTSATPAYTSRGKIQKIAMTNVASVMKDNWASGVATVSYEGEAKGWNSDELLSSAQGKAEFVWNEGALPHIDIDANGRPLHFKVFGGKLELRNGVLSITESKLHAPNSIYLVSGTASLGRNLEVKLERDGAPTYSVTGTLERPTVSVVHSAATQAKLSSSQSR